MALSPILLLPPRTYPEQAGVERVWKRRSWRVLRLDRLAPPPGLARERVKLYGDYEFCVVIARTLGLELVSPPDELLVGLEQCWLKRDVKALTLGAVLSGSFPMFVKSLAPKLFRAGVYANPRALEREITGLPDETPVLVSESVSWQCEVRCLVLEGRIVSSSVFEGKGNEAEAAEFAQEFVNHHLLPTTLVLDVGMIEGRDWAVVEANAVWGSGLNGCDPEAMADCVAEATQVTS